MYDELTTEGVQSILENSRDKIVVHLPLMSSKDLAIDRSTGFLRMLEEELKQDEIEIIIFTSNSFVHTRIGSNEKLKKSEIAERLAYKLHPDYIPYSKFIVAVPKNDKNFQLLKRLTLRYGIDFD